MAAETTPIQPELPLAELEVQQRIDEASARADEHIRQSEAESKTLKDQVEGLDKNHRERERSKFEEKLANKARQDFVRDHRDKFSEDEQADLERMAEQTAHETVDAHRAEVEEEFQFATESKNLKNALANDWDSAVDLLDEHYASAEAHQDWKYFDRLSSQLRPGEQKAYAKHREALEAAAQPKPELDSPFLEMVEPTDERRTSQGNPVGEDTQDLTPEVEALRQSRARAADRATTGSRFLHGVQVGRNSATAGQPTPPPTSPMFGTAEDIPTAAGGEQTKDWEQRVRDLNTLRLAALAGDQTARSNLLAAIDELPYDEARRYLQESPLLNPGLPAAPARNRGAYEEHDDGFDDYSDDDYENELDEAIAEVDAEEAPEHEEKEPAKKRARGLGRLVLGVATLGYSELLRYADRPFTPEEQAHYAEHGRYSDNLGGETLGEMVAHERQIRAEIESDPTLRYQGGRELTDKEYNRRVEVEYWKQVAGYDIDAQRPIRATFLYPNATRDNARATLQSLRNEIPQGPGESDLDYDIHLEGELIARMESEYDRSLRGQGQNPRPYSRRENQRRQQRRSAAAVEVAVAAARREAARKKEEEEKSK